MTKETSYIFSKRSQFAASCNLSNEKEWLNSSRMNLDESQFEAIKLALENRLTFIQG